MTSISAVSPVTLDILYSGLPRIPSLGEEVFAEKFDVQIGGGPATTLITLSRLGIEVGLGTFLADDFASKIAKDILDEQRVNYTNLYNGKGIPVVVTSVASFPEDRYFLTYNPEINETMCSEEELYRMLSGSKICLGIKGYGNLLRRLKSEGTKVVFDIGWQDDLSLELLKDTLEGVNVFTPNDKEALKISGCSDILDALDILSKHVDLVIITLGKDGCITKCNNEVIHVPAVEFEAVDSTGAGDNFLAGIIYGLYQNWPVKKCMQFGNITGGYSTTALGCCKAEITKDKALQLLEFHYGQD